MIGYIIIGLNVIVSIAFLYFIYKSKDKWKGLIHYEAIRDKLTLRPKPKPKPKEEPEEYIGFNLGNLLGGFIVILIGINIIPVISDTINESVSVNETGVGLSLATESLLGIISLMFIFGGIAVGISLAIGGLRGSGLI